NDLFDEAYVTQVPPMPAARHAEMLADWDALDEAWQSHDTEAPAFYGLAAVFRRLPVEDDSPAPEVEASAAPSAEAEPAQAATTAPPVAPVAQPSAGAAVVPVGAPASAAPAVAAVHAP